MRRPSNFLTKIEESSHLNKEIQVAIFGTSCLILASYICRSNIRLGTPGMGKEQTRGYPS